MAGKSTEERVREEQAESVLEAIMGASGDLIARVDAKTAFNQAVTAQRKEINQGITTAEANVASAFPDDEQVEAWRLGEAFEQQMAIAREIEASARAKQKSGLASITARILATSENPPDDAATVVLYGASAIARDAARKYRAAQDKARKAAMI